jgi:hypothetical protein
MFINPLENYDLIRNAERFVSSLGKEPKQHIVHDDSANKTLREPQDPYKFKIRK